MKLQKLQKGQILIQVIIFSTIAILLITGLVGWATTNIKAGRQALYREQAIQIAEAGIDYYRWHLAHAPQDFQDGTGAPGPYTHDFKDKNGNIIGQFILTITPPSTGSVLVTVVSEGKIATAPDISRKIMVRTGISSWAKYSYVSDSFVWFGENEQTFGEVHSNNGVRLDSIAHNLVTSAVMQMDEPGDGITQQEFGVFTHKAPADPHPPEPVPDRSDVFLAGRSLGVPAVDFIGLIGDLSQLKIKAQTNDGHYFANSGSQGYHIVLKTDDTFDIFRVTNLVPRPSNCLSQSSWQPGWEIWSIQNETLLGNYPFPANGIIFVEDHVWVDGQINSARITIASGHFPEVQSTNTNIIVNNNLRYTAFDGSDSIGLIAQNHFLVGLKSADNLEIDAAIIAKNGSTQRYYYDDNCGERSRSVIVLQGMSASYLQGNVFAYSIDGVNILSGYNTVTHIHDSNLLFAPPPNFPLASNQYTILSWEEVK